jgi:hypothetical protein
MALYTKLSGDAIFTPAAAKFFREETRLWYVRLDTDSGASTLDVGVYLSEVDANASSGAVASGSTAAAAAGYYTVSLSDESPDPAFTGASIAVTLASDPSGSETAVWKVDLGPRLERCVLRVLRGVNTYADGTNDYAHDFTVELGVKQFEDVSTFPYFGVGRAALTQESAELGTGTGGNKSYTWLIECVAHNQVTNDSVDSNAIWMFHDVRRALAALDAETYTGDGKVYSLAQATLAEPDRPVEWARERATVVFDVIITLQELASEIVAG